MTIMNKSGTMKKTATGGEEKKEIGAKANMTAVPQRNKKQEQRSLKNQGQLRDQKVLIVDGMILSSYSLR